MQNAEMRIKLGRMIRKAARSAKVRQVRLAEELGITASAVSQMISGKMTPSMPQLEAMLRVLKTDRLTEAEMRNCLTGVRVGGKSVRSPWNQKLRAARKEQGLSVQELSEKTGIRTADLRAMENRAGMYPSATEAARLAAALDRQVEDFRPETQFDWDEAGTFRSVAAMQLADGGAGTPGLFRMPLLELFMLNYYDPNEMDVAAFLQQYGGSRMLNAPEPETVAVMAAGPELGLPEAQTVHVVAAPLEPVTPGSLVIGRDGAGTVRVGVASETTVQAWLPAGKSAEPLQEWSWYWPVRRLNVEHRMETGMLRD